MRAAQQLSSSVQERCMRLQARLRELEAECDRLNRIAKPVPELTPVPKKWNYTTIMVVIVALVVAFFPTVMAEKPEVDCRELIDGCYLEDGYSGTEISYDDFVNTCYGRTRTRLTLSSYNETRLVAECRETLAKYHMENVAWMHDWCTTHIRQRIKPVKCVMVAWQDRIITEVLDIVLTVQNAQKVFSIKFFHYLSVFLVVFTFLYERRFFPALLILSLVCLAKIPLFMASVAVNCFQPITLILYFALLIVDLPNAHWQWVVFVVHWVVMVLVAFFSKSDALPSISVAIAGSLFLPAWYIATRTVQYFEISPTLQVLTFVLGLTWAVGLKYLSVTVTTTDTEGNVTKIKRYDLVKKSVANAFLKLQNATRGIVPAIPEKSDSVVYIETSVGQGVGFRFMNYIVTAGHVIGPDSFVKVTWRGITCTSKVKKVEELIECPETLVFLSLPSELQGVKPLRLSKISGSDYVSLICYDGSFQQVVQFTGWGAVDGHWISTAFETHPGNSGGPYVDRFGRLIGIHLGTQGVLAQGYKINDFLEHHRPVSTKETVVAKTDEVITPVQQQSTQNIDEISDALLAKLIKGTKVSHAAILTEIEKLVERVAKLEKDNERLEQTNQNLADMLVKALEDTPVFGFEKKKKRRHDRAAFNKIKVLTEEQYKEMIENGWTRDQIREAVNSLREQAYTQYLMELEDEGEPEDYINDEIEREFTSTGYWEVKDGVRSQTIMQSVIQQARRVRKRQPFNCKFCNKVFENWHDRQKCRKEQEKKNSGQDEQPKKEEPCIEQKNGKKGSKPSTPKPQ
nr:MAG: nsp1a [Astroviridae sp.]